MPGGGTGRGRRRTRRTATEQQSGAGEQRKEDGFKTHIDGRDRLLD